MRLKFWEIALFPTFGILMFVSKLMLEFLPNFHLIATFIITFTVVYRTKALIPIYIFVFLTGLYSGFALWWLPYLYIWTVLWAIVMLIPTNLPRRIAIPVYMAVGFIHGISFGTLYAPSQALLFGLDFSGMIAWIIAGLYFDILHGVGNLLFGTLTVPMITLLKKLSIKK